MGHDRYRIQYRGIQSRSPPISQAAQVLEGQPRCTSRHSDLISHPHANSNTFQESFGVSSIYHTIQILEFFWRNMHLQHLKFPIHVFHFLQRHVLQDFAIDMKSMKLFFFFLQKKKIPAAATAWHDLSILIFHGSFNLCPSILPVILLKEKHALSWNLRQRYFWPRSWGIMDKRTTQRKAKVGKYRMSWEMRMSFCHRDELC